MVNSQAKRAGGIRIMDQGVNLLAEVGVASRDADAVHPGFAARPVVHGPENPEPGFPSLPFCKILRPFYGRAI